MQRKIRLLIVEDEEIIRNALKKVLVRQQYDVAEAGSVEEAIPLLETQVRDLVDRLAGRS